MGTTSFVPRLVDFVRCRGREKVIRQDKSKVAAR